MRFDVDKFSERLTDARINKNLTQNDIAAKLQITQSAYSKIELGKNSASIDQVFMLADILEISPTYLLGIGGEFQHDILDDMQKVINKYK